MGMGGGRRGQGACICGLARERVMGGHEAGKADIDGMVGPLQLGVPLERCKENGNAMAMLWQCLGD